VGTDRSLLRYEGQVWREYADPEFVYVHEMAEDGAGRLWFAGGVNTRLLGYLESGRRVGVTHEGIRAETLFVDGRGNVWAGSWSGGPFIRWPWEDLPTAVGAEPGPALPQSFGLLQNRPNPFNQQTQISFALPVTQQASLEVRNATGQRVTTLAAGQFTAGAHVVNWDGRDARGMAVGSGVYLCRLAAASGTDVRKLTLLR